MKDEEAIRELKRRYGEKLIRKYYHIASELKVNRGLLWQVLNGKTRSNKVRLALGMKHLRVEVDPCAKCGSVNLMKSCPNCRKQRKAVVKKLDPDIKALRGAIRALNQSSNKRMLKANLDFLYDRYITNPTKELPEHLKK